MGFFEDKLAATGRAVDSAMDRAMGSSSPGAMGRRAGDVSAWVRDRADLLDDAMARRGVNVSSLMIAKGLVAALLLFVTGWSIVHVVRSMTAKPIPVAATPADEAESAALSERIVDRKRNEAEQVQMTLPTAGTRRGSGTKR